MYYVLFALCIAGAFVGHFYRWKQELYASVCFNDERETLEGKSEAGSIAVIALIAGAVALSINIGLDSMFIERNLLILFAGLPFVTPLFAKNK